MIWPFPYPNPTLALACLSFCLHSVLVYSFTVYRLAKLADIGLKRGCCVPVQRHGTFYVCELHSTSLMTVVVLDIQWRLERLAYIHSMLCMFVHVHVHVFMYRPKPSAVHLHIYTCAHSVLVLYAYWPFQYLQTVVWFGGLKASGEPE